MLRLRMFIVESTVQDDSTTNISIMNSLTSTMKSSDTSCFEQVGV